MCRSGKHILYDENLNPAHFSDHLKTIMKIRALVLD